MPSPFLKERWKLIAGIALILVTITWLAISGIQESKTYYVTIAELKSMGDDAYVRRLRVGGDVAVGSIQRDGSRVSFTLIQQEKDKGAQTLRVIYTGTEPLPDTFRDRAQALADGSFGRDGVFTAKKIQAKCASKYEAQRPRAAAAGGTSGSSAKLDAAGAAVPAK